MRISLCLLLLSAGLAAGCKTDKVDCVADPTRDSCVEACRSNPTAAWCGDGSVPRDMPGGDAGPCGVCGEGLVCDEDTLACVGCLSDAECTTAEASVCGAANECGACATDADCDHDGLPAACVAGVGCFACNEDDTESDDCDGAAPVCDATSRECRACTEHTECAAGLCLDGTCPAEGDILWVDGDAACDDAGSGTSAAPFCQIQAALDDGSAEIIAVREDVSDDYAPISWVSGGSATIVAVEPGASIFQRTATEPAVRCINGSTLTVVGMTITGRKEGTVTGPGITTSACTLTLTDVNVSGNGGAGISATGGTVTLSDVNVSGNGDAGLVASAGADLTVRRSEFSGNEGGGLDLAGTTYLIENSLIANNGRTGEIPPVGGVNIQATATGAFINNTITDNRGNFVGGISCGSAASSLVNTLVTRNALMGPVSSNVATCTVDPSSYADDDAVLGGADGYHLTAASTCCVDQGTDTDAPADDIDGDERPCGEGIDIGADELCP